YQFMSLQPAIHSGLGDKTGSFSCFARTHRGEASPWRGRRLCHGHLEWGFSSPPLLALLCPLVVKPSPPVTETVQFGPEILQEFGCGTPLIWAKSFKLPVLSGHSSPVYVPLFYIYPIFHSMFARS